MATEPFPSVWPRAGSRPQLETSAAGLAGIAPARHAAAAHLQRCGCVNIDDAVLVLSELVTNAVIHGGGADRILIACDDAVIGISVQDSEPQPARSRDEIPSVGGRGLHLVERLSRDWGSEPLPGGKSVWAVLPTAPPGPLPGAAGPP